MSDHPKKGVVDLRPYFGLTRFDKHLPEELGKINFLLKHKQLMSEEQHRLNFTVIFAWRSKLPNFGPAAGIELAGKLGCWLLLHDPENTCSQIIKRRKKENLI